MSDTVPAGNTPATIEKPTVPFIIFQNPLAQIQDTLSDILGGMPLNVGNLDRIKAPSGTGKTFEIPSVTGITSSVEFEGIIIHKSRGRVYFPGDNAVEGTIPDCYSDDAVTGVGRDADGGLGGSCEECPLAQFGSEPKNGVGQACKEVLNLYIIREGGLLPMVLQLSPTSIKSITPYIYRMASSLVPLNTVVTKFTLKEARSTGGVKYHQVEASVASRDGKPLILSPQEQVVMRAITDSLKPHLSRTRRTSAAPAATE